MSARFADLLASLPNGLHDAQLRRLAMDYVRGELVLELDVWTGSMAATRREIYRPARVTLGAVAFLSIDPPGIREELDVHTSIRIDAGNGPAKDAQLPEAPSGTSIAWIFLADLNCFLHFAAGQASLAWTGPEEDRG